MSKESLGYSEIPNRALVRSAIEQYPDDTELLSQVESLSSAAYAALDFEINKGVVTYNDFAIYEQDGNDIAVMSDLLSKLEVAETEEERRLLAGQIAMALSA